MRYSISNQDFRTLREAGATYVDKTEHIARILDSGSYFFLSRPRRFGKSLTVSTIRELYSGDRELFGGLWAHEHWRFAERQRPVLWLKFSSIAFEKLGVESAILYELYRMARKAGYELPQGLPVKLAFRELIEAAAQTHPSGRVVILIDEYDKPIVEYIDDIPKAEANRDELKPFYSVLKDAEPYIELVFITGVSAFSKVSLFSELNNLANLTMDPLADTLVGFTEAELDYTFGARLAEIGSAREKVKRWYNGYSWGRPAVRVYNPWSILHYLRNGYFENYWVASGTPTLLTKMMRIGGEFDVAGTSADAVGLTSLDLTRITPLQLLFQTGYLTVRERGAVDGMYVLDYPNAEVRASFLDNLLAAYSFSDITQPSQRLDRLMKSLRAGDVAGVIGVINDNFAGIPYQIWEAHSERYYHAIVHTMFSMLGTHFRSEVSVAGGRADAIVETDGYVYAFEFKLDRPAAAALAQIEAKGYLAPYADSGKELVAVGVSFSSKEKRVAEWSKGDGFAI